MIIFIDQFYWLLYITHEKNKVLQASTNTFIEKKDEKMNVSKVLSGKLPMGLGLVIVLLMIACSPPGDALVSAIDDALSRPPGYELNGTYVSQTQSGEDAYTFALSSTTGTGSWTLNFANLETDYVCFITYTANTFTVVSGCGNAGVPDGSQYSWTLSGNTLTITSVGRSPFIVTKQ